MSAPAVRIIADDLTGAVDAAAPFARHDGALVVYWHDHRPVDDVRMALDTGTRDADAATAAQRVRVAAACSWRDFAGIAFKKVDSVWRGQPAVEIAAAMDGGGFDRAIVAPAFPAQGRHTRRGAQWVARNATAQCVAADLAFDLRAVGLRAARAGEAHGDEGVLVCDAETQQDLDAIVRHHRCGRPTLWCGSAGLAHALADSLAGGHGSSPAAMPVRPIAGPVIVVVGTDHPVAQQQADVLAQMHGVQELRLAIGPRHPSTANDARIADLHRAAPILLVRFDVAPGMPRETVSALADAMLAHAIPRLPRPRLAIVTGGETLRALADALGATALLVHDERAPGVAHVTWRDGAWTGLPAYTKSGGYGLPVALVDLVSTDGAASTSPG